ncbi:MAG: hypothetical protein CMH31_06225 [Micavibrio sp.]|nr:hypothetical protein [Micavibrio sp.]
MLQILGIKKTLFLLILFSISALAFSYKFFYLVPRVSSIESEASLNQSDVFESGQKISDLVDNHERFVEQKNRYDFIKNVNFFNDQNRLEVRKLIAEAINSSKVVSAKYNIGALKVERNSSAKEVDHKLLKTDITFDVGAIDDADIYNFILLLNHGFPGVLVIEEVGITRTKELTQPILKQIGTGVPVSLVEAKIKIVWWTMVQKDAVEATASLMEAF